MDKKNRVIIKVLIFIIVLFVLGLIVRSVISGTKRYSVNVDYGTNADISYDKDFVRVHIKGAVKNPGVYTVRPGHIVGDIVNMAGGYTEDADTEYQNLSEKLFDGMEINVPSKESKSASDIYKDILDMDIDD